MAAIKYSDYHGGKQLKTKKVSEEIFNRILHDYECQVELDRLDNWYCGYQGKKDKNIIILDQTKNEMIVKEYILNGYLDDEYKNPNCTDWKQVRLRLVEDAVYETDDDITGSQAWKHVYNDILKKHYTDIEIDEILRSHERDTPNIYNYLPAEWLEAGIIIKISNCYYYDINSAYMDALSELFPRCKSLFEKMFIERKIHPINKCYANYFCGMLCKKDYRKTFNWITNRTHDILFDMMDKLGGTILYAKTDGFFISNPNNVLPTSKELGKFKLELTNGDVYFYKDRNYYLMQYTNDKGEIEFKGSALCEVRKDVDLSIGQVVHYQTKTHPILKYRYAENITKEIIKNEEDKNSN